MRFTKAQRKIIYASVIVIIAIFLFLVFIYLPRSREVAGIKDSLQSAERNIVEITGATEGRELIDIARELGINLNQLRSQLPSQDETVIKNLSEEARKRKIEIKRINFSKKGKSTYQTGSFNIEELAVSMDLAGEYRDLGMYLETLRYDSPILITVNKIAIKGEGEGRPNLNISLDITAYLSK